MATVFLYILLLFFGIGICQIEIRSSISSKSQCSSEKDGCISLSFNSVQDLKNKLEDKNFQDRLAEQIKRQLLNEADKPTSPEENVDQLLFINKSMTYKQSKEYCHNMSRNLVSGYIRNKTVLNFTKIGDTRHLWIGLDELNGFWRWADGVNSTANNTNWETNQPENDKLEDKNFQDRLAEQIKRQLLNEAEKPTSPEENVGQLLFINKSMTYKQSKEYCHNMSRNLVSGYIRNKTVLNFTKIGDAHSLWIGLDELNGFWRWADGVNSTANNTNWGTNQPENNNEKCAVVFPKNNWTIHDYPCDNPPHNFSFICEKKITDQC